MNFLYEILFTMLHFKGVKFFVFLAFVLFAFAGIYYFSFSNKQNLPSQNLETVGWETYTDIKTGVTFRYPNWRILREDEDNSKLTVEFEILGSTYVYERTASNADIEDLQSTDKKTMNGVTWDVAKGELKYKCATTECVVHYTTRDDYIFSFYGPRDTPELQDQVLSTFKFTNS